LLIRSKDLETWRAKIIKEGLGFDLKYVEINGIKYLVDGNHRARIMQDLGAEFIAATKVDLPYLGFRTTNDVLKQASYAQQELDFLLAHTGKKWTDYMGLNPPPLDL
jgi:hypothetical protein